MRRGKAFGSPLSKALTVQMRVFADLAHRALTLDGSGTSYACWTRRGMLVVAARGWTAREIEVLLGDVNITPQRDKPEQIVPSAAVGRFPSPPAQEETP